jgi:KaiC/GvpD/RAD55 family RecA-like ATPase
MSVFQRKRHNQKRQRLRTYVSKAYWCNPRERYSFKEAKLKLSESDDSGTAWLDQLFEGGIVIPGNPDGTVGRTNALTLLITGPPGTGKTTLATELAYRWCTTDAWNEILGDRKKPRIIYVSSESKAPWIVNNAISLGWADPAHVFETSNDRLKPIDSGKVRILALPITKDLEGFAKTNAKEMGFAEFIGMGDKQDAEVVIIDSLNTVAEQKVRSRIFSNLYHWASEGPRIMVMVLDSSADPSNVWEFVSDVVIRLDRKYDDSGYTGYMIRSLEILKARYQKHVWGRHQLKIYEGSRIDESVWTITDKDASDRMRAHPYRTEGGVFIFPSIHYLLSLYKRNAPTGLAEPIPSCVPHLNKLLGGGYPKGRCTALIGSRGGHKSHLGYEEILGRIFPADEAGHRDFNSSERALVVSLRDDEGLTKETMVKILKRGGVAKAEVKLAELQQSGLLEIIYYPPGYITPEEFFHRLLLTIKRLKSEQSDLQVSLLFNSLEQLSSRFPLCEKEPIFVPGIIQMLIDEEVSSFFVTNELKETYGLETMAELIVEFSQRSCNVEEYLEYIDKTYGAQVEDLGSLRSKVWTDRSVIMMRVGRYAGGQAAGAEGILELVEKGKDHPLEEFANKGDLLFMPSAGIKKRSPQVA